MGRASSTKQRRRASDMSSKAKGSLAEQIVAAMHEAPGVTVATNVFLPAGGAGRRRREIDVLITTTVVGYPVRFAIECKNESKITDAPKIDAFVGKLSDVGIPPQCGVFVSVRGYTSGAIERAKKEGIQTLILAGLTSDRLQSAIFKALQSVVYYLLQIQQINVTYKEIIKPTPQEMPILRDNTGKLRLMIPDIVWRQWLDGEPPTALGECEMEVPIPDGSYQKVGDELVELASVSARVQVFGLVLSLGGVVTQHVLSNADHGATEKLQSDVKFEPPQRALPIDTVPTEEALAAKIQDTAALVRITARIRLPRIRFNGVYWPPSERIMQALHQRVQAFKAGELSEPQAKDFAELEGTDLSTV